MLLITDLLSVLQGQVSSTNLQHLAVIIQSILSLSRPVTTLSIARISSLSYRTIQRFYALTDVNWLLINLLLFRAFVYKQGKIYLLAADETVEGKAGKHTYGLSHFYSSIIQKAIKSVSFLAIVLIDVEAKKSFFVACQQIIANPKKPTPDPEKTPPIAALPKPKGRPKGSKNKPKTEPKGTSYQTLKTILSLVMSPLRFLLPELNCFHLVLDGFYGHEDYLLLALENRLQIISKFKTNAHLTLPYTGPQSGKGRPKTKGDRVDLTQLPAAFLVESIQDTATKISTHVYQFKAYTPKMATQLLNIVVLVHTHSASGKQSRTVLFTNDLNLSASQVVTYYSLRFQIEFDFRDAKQFYGLSSFKNYKQAQVTTAVNLSFTMTLLGKLILEKYKTKLSCPGMGIADLKTVFKLQSYAQGFFKDNKEQADAFLNSPEFLNLARLEAIHI